MAEKDNFQQRLLEAIEQSDTHTREARANRIIWLSRFQKPHGIVVGELESSSLLEEARVCYVNEHYIATVLAATAFVEHTLAQELQARQIGRRRSYTLEQAIIAARDAGLVPKDLLRETDKLRAVRNALAHRKPRHRDTLSERFRKEKMHPSAVLERDAQLAIEVMYAYFELTLAESSPTSSVTPDVR